MRYSNLNWILIVVSLIASPGTRVFARSSTEMPPRKRPHGDAAILWGPRGWGCLVTTPPGWIIDDNIDHAVAEASIHEEGAGERAARILLVSLPHRTKNGNKLTLPQYLQQAGTKFASAQTNSTVLDETPLPTADGRKALVIRFTPIDAPHRTVQVWLEDRTGYTLFEASASSQAEFARLYPVLKNVVSNYKRLDARQRTAKP